MCSALRIGNKLSSVYREYKTGMKTHVITVAATSIKKQAFLLGLQLYIHVVEHSPLGTLEPERGVINSHT